MKKTNRNGTVTSKQHAGGSLAAVNALLLPLILALSAVPLTGQEEDPGEDRSDPGFRLDTGVGVGTFREEEYRTYQSLRVQPEFRFGPFAAGLDINLNYTFSGSDDGSSFEVRKADWVADEVLSPLEIYLPKIEYLRWNEAADPLFAQFGRIDDATFGNGFILGGYTNRQFLPERGQFGFAFEVDSSLVNASHGGLETVVSNIPAFDLFGGRLHTLAFSDLEIGATVVTDRNPYYHAEKNPDGNFFDDGERSGDESVLVWGVDIRQPIIDDASLSMTAFLDGAVQNANPGGRFGVVGRAFGVLDYTGELRAFGQNFIPNYFDSIYDLYRPERYAVYSGAVEAPATLGWRGATGVSLLQESFSVNLSMEGSFAPLEPESIDGRTNPVGLARNPAIRASLVVGEGVIPGVTAQALYEKRNITGAADIVDPRSTVVGARVNFRTGPAVIALHYDLRHDPRVSAADWRVNSGLQSTISVY